MNPAMFFDNDVSEAKYCQAYVSERDPVISLVSKNSESEDLHEISSEMNSTMDMDNDDSEPKDLLGVFSEINLAICMDNDVLEPRGCQAGSSELNPTSSNYIENSESKECQEIALELNTVANVDNGNADPKDLQVTPSEICIHNVSSQLKDQNALASELSPVTYMDNYHAGPKDTQEVPLETRQNKDWEVKRLNANARKICGFDDHSYSEDMIAVSTEIEVASEIPIGNDDPQPKSQATALSKEHQAVCMGTENMVPNDRQGDSGKEGDERRLHVGFQCNVCTSDIVGFRYTCVQCADYDLCCACEARGHHPAHYVLRVPEPRPFAEVQWAVERVRSELARGLLPRPFLDEGLYTSVKTELMTVNLEEDEVGEEGVRGASLLRGAALAPSELGDERQVPSIQDIASIERDLISAETDLERATNATVVGDIAYNPVMHANNADAIDANNKLVLCIDTPPGSDHEHVYLIPNKTHCEIETHSVCDHASPSRIDGTTLLESAVDVSSKAGVSRVFEDNIMPQERREDTKFDLSQETTPTNNADLQERTQNNEVTSEVDVLRQSDNATTCFNVADGTLQERLGVQTGGDILQETEESNCEIVQETNESNCNTLQETTESNFEVVQETTNPNYNTEEKTIASEYDVVEEAMEPSCAQETLVSYGDKLQETTDTEFDVVQPTETIESRCDLVQDTTVSNCKTLQEPTGSQYCEVQEKTGLNCDIVKEKTDSQHEVVREKTDSQYDVLQETTDTLHERMGSQHCDVQETTELNCDIVQEKKDYQYEVVQEIISSQYDVVEETASTDFNVEPETTESHCEALQDTTDVECDVAEKITVSNCDILQETVESNNYVPQETTQSTNIDMNVTEILKSNLNIIRPSDNTTTGFDVTDTNLSVDSDCNLPQDTNVSSNRQMSSNIQIPKIQKLKVGRPKKINRAIRCKGSGRFKSNLSKLRVETDCDIPQKAEGSNTQKNTAFPIIPKTQKKKVGRPKKSGNNAISSHIVDGVPIAKLGVEIDSDIPHISKRLNMEIPIAKPLKKKIGRPRKSDNNMAPSNTTDDVPIANTNVETDCVIPQETKISNKKTPVLTETRKRKIYRPRKYDNITTPFYMTGLPIAKLRVATNCEVPRETKCLNDTQITESPITQKTKKRKVGMIRKRLKNMPSYDETNVPLVKFCVETDCNIAQEPNTSNTEIAITKTLKRKVGRPRKSDSNTNTDMTHDVPVEELSVGTDSVNNVQNTEILITPDTQERKVGISKKLLKNMPSFDETNVIQTDHDIAQEPNTSNNEFSITKTLKKKVGRPRKSDSNTVPTDITYDDVPITKLSTETDDVIPQEKKISNNLQHTEIPITPDTQGRKVGISKKLLKNMPSFNETNVPLSKFGLETDYDISQEPNTSNKELSVTKTLKKKVGRPRKSDSNTVPTDITHGVPIANVSTETDNVTPQETNISNNLQHTEIPTTPDTQERKVGISKKLLKNMPSFDETNVIQTDHDIAQEPNTSNKELSITNTLKKKIGRPRKSNSNTLPTDITQGVPIAKLSTETDDGTPQETMFANNEQKTEILTTPDTKKRKVGISKKLLKNMQSFYETNLPLAKYGVETDYDIAQEPKTLKGKVGRSRKSDTVYTDNTYGVPIAKFSAEADNVIPQETETSNNLDTEMPVTPDTQKTKVGISKKLLKNMPSFDETNVPIEKFGVETACNEAQEPNTSNKEISLTKTLKRKVGRPRKSDNNTLPTSVTHGALIANISAVTDSMIPQETNISNIVQNTDIPSTPDTQIRKVSPPKKLLKQMTSFDEADGVPLANLIVGTDSDITQEAKSSNNIENIEFPVLLEMRKKKVGRPRKTEIDTSIAQAEFSACHKSENTVVHKIRRTKVTKTIQKAKHRINVPQSMKVDISVLNALVEDMIESSYPRIFLRRIDEKTGSSSFAPHKRLQRAKSKYVPLKLENSRPTSVVPHSFVANTEYSDNMLLKRLQDTGSGVASQKVVGHFGSHTMLQKKTQSKRIVPQKRIRRKSMSVVPQSTESNSVASQTTLANIGLGSVVPQKRIRNCKSIFVDSHDWISDSESSTSSVPKKRLPKTKSTSVISQISTESHRVVPKRRMRNSQSMYVETQDWVPDTESVCDVPKNRTPKTTKATSVVSQVTTPSTGSGVAQRRKRNSKSMYVESPDWTTCAESVSEVSDMPRNRTPKPKCTSVVSQVTTPTTGSHGAVAQRRKRNSKSMYVESPDWITDPESFSDMSRTPKIVSVASQNTIQNTEWIPYTESVNVVSKDTTTKNKFTGVISQNTVQNTGSHGDVPQRRIRNSKSMYFDPIDWITDIDLVSDVPKKRTPKTKPNSVVSHATTIQNTDWIPYTESVSIVPKSRMPKATSTSVMSHDTTQDTDWIPYSESVSGVPKSRKLEAKSTTIISQNTGSNSVVPQRRIRNSKSMFYDPQDWITDTDSLSDVPKRKTPKTKSPCVVQNVDSHSSVPQNIIQITDTYSTAPQRRNIRSNSVVTHSKLPKTKTSRVPQKKVSRTKSISARPQNQAKTNVQPRGRISRTKSIYIVPDNVSDSDSESASVVSYNTLFNSGSINDPPCMIPKIKPNSVVSLSSNQNAELVSTSEVSGYVNDFPETITDSDTTSNLSNVSVYSRNKISRRKTKDKESTRVEFSSTVVDK